MKKVKKMALPAWGAAVLLCFALTAGWSAASATSYAAGEGEDHDHTAGWTQIPATGGTIGEGSSADAPAQYYLAADTVLSENLRLAENASVTLCLNGFLLATERVDSVIRIPTGAELTICDCQEESVAAEHSHAYYKDGYGKYVFGYGQEGWQAEYDAAAEKGVLTGGVLTGGDALNVNGGAIRIDGGTLRLTGGAIAGNEASDLRNGAGGAIYAEDGAIYLSGGTIQGNAAGRGAGICMDGGVFSMTGGDISYNMAVKTCSSTLESNTGGGIYATGDYTFAMTGGEIACNTAGYEGGGLYLRGSAVVLEGGAIRGNSASRGGGLAVGAYADVTLKTSLSDNTAESAGGGVCATHGKFTLEEGGSVTGNASGGDGGGLYVTDIAAIKGGVLSDNTAAGNGGGVCVITNDASVSVYGGEISRNVAKNGGGVYAKGTLFMYGGKICANAAETLAGGVAIEANSAKFIQLDMEGGEISGNGEEGYDVYFFGGRKEIRGGYIGRIGEESATEIGGVHYAYFSEEPASSFIGWQSGCILLEDGSLDADFNAAFPYAVYIIRDVELTAKYSNPVYDGSPIEARKDFEVSAPDDVQLVYEYAVSGEDEYTAGLPVNAGDYVIRVDLGEPFLKTTEDGKEYYPSGVRTLELTIDKKIPSFTDPFGLSAEYGKPLSEVTLPHGWVWEDDAIVVDTLGTFEAVAIFTPADPDNYHTLRWSLTLSVYEEVEGGDPTDPPEGGEEPTDPPEGGEEPTDPPEGGEEPTDPPEGGEEPTDPPEGGKEPTDPSEGGEEPEGLTGGAVAGIAIGSTLGAAALAYAVCAILFKKGVIKGAFFAKIFPFFRS